MDRFKFYVVGYYRRKGVFKEMPYDNYYLVCEILYPGASYNEVTGKITKTFKVSNLHGRFERALKGLTLNQVFNHKCMIIADQYDVVTDLEVIE